MAFNTGNPIGSTDARDLSDNAENFDKALGTLDATWTDRFGVTRDSFEGRLAKGSFYRVGDFATGYTLTNMRQTLEYSGHEYSWAGTFPKVVAAGATPATSGGVGAGAWVDRTDDSLRDEIREYVNQAQEEIINGKIFPESGVLSNGMTVTAGTTHLRVLVSGETTIVAMSPIASGLISDLNGTSAVIGDVPVVFSSVSIREFNSVQDMLSVVNTLPVGFKYCTGKGSWSRVKIENSDITDFEPVDGMYIEDFGAKAGVSVDPTQNANAAQECFRASYLLAEQSGFRLDTAKIKSGRGRFRFSPNILLSNNAAGTFNIEGQGYDKTTFSLVVASPQDTEFLFNNANEWAFTTFTGITFETENNNGNLFYLESTGTVQSINFVECRFRRFNGSFWFGPSVQNSEHTFVRCKFNDCANAEYVFRNENAQAVNTRFYATDIHDFPANGFEVLKGFTVYYSQGSIIPGNSGRVIEIPVNAAEASSGGNNPTFFFSGTRFELRGTSQMLRKLNNTFFTHIVWDGCGMGGLNLTGQYPIQYGGNARFTFRDCENLNNWKIDFFSPGSGSRKSSFHIDNCAFPASFISDSLFSLSDQTSNVAMLPLFDIKNNQDPSLNGVFRPKGGYNGLQEKRVQVFSFVKEDKKLAAGVSTFEQQLKIHPGRISKIEFINFATTTYGATNATIRIYNDDKSTLIAERTYQVNAFGSLVVYVDYRLIVGDSLRFEFSNDFSNQTINYTYYGEILITS